MGYQIMPVVIKPPGLVPVANYPSNLPGGMDYTYSGCFFFVSVFFIISEVTTTRPVTVVSSATITTVSIML